MPWAIEFRAFSAKAGAGNAPRLNVGNTPGVKRLMLASKNKTAAVARGACNANFSLRSVKEPATSGSSRVLPIQFLAQPIEVRIERDEAGGALEESLAVRFIRDAIQ